MTEIEWLECDDPAFLLDHIGGKASDRKLRLFAVACCRRIWHLLTDARSRAAVEVTEQYADGLASPEAFQMAMQSAGRVADDEGEQVGEPTPAAVAWVIAYEPPPDAAQSCGSVSVLMDRESRKGQADWWTTHEKEGEEEASHQVLLVRDLFGNPFRPVALDPAWITPGVVKLAQAAYEERQLPSGHLDAGRLAVLADYLEEVGCHDADILTHLRGPGPHVRGCWPVDLLLQKG